MTLYRLNARTDHRQMVGQVLEILLIVIEHRLLEEPVRLSTDPTGRLSTEPLAYGTRSAWRSPDGERQHYNFILVSARVPDDTSGVSAGTQLIVEMHDARLGDLLISTIEPAIVHMALVTKDAPDVPERQWSDHEFDTARIEGGDITFSLRRDPAAELPYGAQRKTADRFPGMHA